MSELSVSGAPAEARALATYAAAVTHSLAREERLARKPRRLTEPAHATWKQFRGRLGSPALLELLREDASVTQPTAFEIPRELGESLDRLPEALTDEWLRTLTNLALDGSATDYVATQARRLELPTRMAKSELYRLRPHHRALELPGSGGQLAHHVVSTQEDVFLQDVFTVACHDWRDFTLAGLIAVELGLSGPAPARIDPELAHVRKHAESYDHVFGLEPDKGGYFPRPQLQAWFPNARVQLV